MAMKDVPVSIRPEGRGCFSIRSPDVPCVVEAMGSEGILRRTPWAVSLHARHHRGTARQVSQRSEVRSLLKVVKVGGT